MSNERRDYRSELQGIMDSLAEYVEHAPEEELLEDATVEGESTNETADRVRLILLDAVTQYQQRPLREARLAYNKQVAAMQQRTYDLPSTPAERRTLLWACLAKNQQMQAMVTGQFRDFDGMTDSDIESLLKQFADLGLLGDSSDPEKDVP